MKTEVRIVVVLMLTLLVGATLTQAAPGAVILAPSGAPTVVAYQGKVALDGAPYKGTGYFKFAVVDASGTTSYWSNDGSSNGGGEPNTGVSLVVKDGLFHVLLGDTAIDNMTEPLEVGVFEGTGRYLRVWFSPDGKSYQQLSPDHRVAAVPYALQAQRAAKADLAPRLDRVAAPADNTVTTLDANFGGGSNSSVTIGTDGLPLIAYEGGNASSLKVAHCHDTACSSATTFTLDSGGGLYPSVTIGADGLGLISYGNGGLKLAYCQNMECSSANTLTLDGSAGVAATSVTIGADGLPLISYSDSGVPMVAHCEDAACSNRMISTLEVLQGLVGYTSVAIGMDGLPLISYNVEGVGLRVAHCEVPDCRQASIVEGDGVVEGPDVVCGLYTSVTIGADGLGLIGYWYLVSGFPHGGGGYSALKVVHCNDVVCSSVTSSLLDSQGGPSPDDIGLVGKHTSVTIGTDGLGLISYIDEINGDLKVAHCKDAACSSAYVTTLGSGVVDEYSSTAVTIGADGLPLISYYDDTGGSLNVVRCSNVFCRPYFRRR